MSDPVGAERPGGDAADAPLPVLVAGASGTLGRHVVAELLSRGHRVRAMSRRPVAAGALPAGVEAVVADAFDEASLARATAGAGAVVSSLGASMDVYAWKDRRPYTLVDVEGNAALARAARAAGVTRFVYTSVFAEGRLEEAAYVVAHRRAEDAVARAGLDVAVVRPTGFFGFLDDLLAMARRGWAPVIGPGRAVTNPVHEGDVARALVDSLSRPAGIVEVGGPDVHSRRELAELAASVAGGRARVVHSPAALWTGLGRLLAPVQPRLGQLFEFAALVSTHDAVAPRVGRRRLEDHFRRKVGEATGARS